MERNAMQELVKWKGNTRRKPLIIKGARQVGKTWLMKEFGRRFYDNTIYINFDSDSQEKKIFEQTKSASTIISNLEILFSKKINASKTLLILDEIQECPNAIGSLKYFNEDANEYHIVAAGSLLGTVLAKKSSYPVGKVNLLNIYPLTFDEFLSVIDAGMYKYSCDYNRSNAGDNVFHDTLLKYYREYLIIGGMPECVKSWAENHDPEEIQTIQNELITIYENDITKHNGKVNSGRLLQVFRSISSQLAKENSEKFVYGAVREGGRARDFEEAIEWLVSAGLIHKVVNVSKPVSPIKPYEITNYFKLFMFDTGLLKFMAGVPNGGILLDEDFAFKGALTENFVLQQLLPKIKESPHYFAKSNELEIDFLLQNEMEIIPVEVKAGKGKRATSFKNYISKYAPKSAIRLNSNAYVKNGEITNIPLYFAGKLFELI